MPPDDEEPRREATGPIRTRRAGTKTALILAAFALLLVIAVFLWQRYRGS